MTDRTDDILTARWTAVPNNEIGGWAVSSDGLGPLNGGVMAADMVWSQQVAEHIVDLHNQRLDVRNTSDAELVARALDGPGMLNGQVWMLRSPCGCLWGTSMAAYTEPQAWDTLHGGDPSMPRPPGWTLTLEPSEAAIPEAREQLGKCTHLTR